MQARTAINSTVTDCWGWAPPCRGIVGVAAACFNAPFLFLPLNFWLVRGVHVRSTAVTPQFDDMHRRLLFLLCLHPLFPLNLFCLTWEGPLLCQFPVNTRHGKLLVPLLVLQELPVFGNVDHGCCIFVFEVEQLSSLDWKSALFLSWALPHWFLLFKPSL